MGRLAAGAKSRIEELPEVTRRKVISALLEGKSLRKVAEIAGISHTQVALYKNTIFAETLREAEQLQSIQQLAKPDSVRFDSVSDTTKLTENLIKTSPFRERLEKLWVRTDRALDKAEKAVRVVKDSQGNVVDIAEDLGAIAPLLNQAHKNVALLGKATGELIEAPQIQVGVQVVMPAAPAATPATIEREAPTYTIALQKPR